MGVPWLKLLSAASGSVLSLLVAGAAPALARDWRVPPGCLCMCQQPAATPWCSRLAHPR